jgi:thiol-disulfide isomerase/thioredoxin
MKKNNMILVILLILIVGAIYYFESQKAAPVAFEDTQDSVSVSIVEQPSEETLSDLSPEEQERLAEKATKYDKAPELTGIVGYLNAEEGLQISDFKGKVVLIDFWTYTCINCIRTLPHITSWDAKYKDKGLVIIGVHTPEFEFEKKKENVQASMDKHNIQYAVVQDNDYKTWRAFKNRYWPRKYLIDADGFIRYDHIGEGAYQQTEEMIQKLLVEAGYDLGDLQIQKPENEFTIQLQKTPELYGGWEFALPRGQNIGNKGGIEPGMTVTYVLPDDLDKDTIYLEGTWLSTADNLQAQEASASVVLAYTAKEVNIVANTLAEPVTLEVFIDDNYITEERAGSDIQFEGEKAFITVNEPRLYNLIQGKHGSHKLTLTTDSDDFNFNAFTFG